MKKIISPGSVIGGMLLIGGSCIGAGMLALPIITGLCGFIPSIFLFLISWAFMTTTALLVLEVNGSFSKQVNFVSMVGQSLGSYGKFFSWFLYLFLFCSLLVAYVSGSGGIASSFVEALTSFNISSFASSLFFVIVFGFVVYLGTKAVDIFNRFLMFGLIFAYAGVLFFGVFKVNFVNLSHIDLRYSLISLPILITSFGFHNMIPSLTAYMHGDIDKMRKVIIGGSLITLGIYLLWNAVVLGVVPLDGKLGLKESYFSGKEASQVVKVFFEGTWVGAFVQAFAFFAIVTSFLAQALGLMHFLADGLKVSLVKKNTWWLTILAILPSSIFAWIYPSAFFKALSFAGGFCAVILFGVFPAMMVWLGRYKKKIVSKYHVFGGRKILIVAMIYSVFIFILEMLKIFEPLTK